MRSITPALRWSATLLGCVGFACNRGEGPSAVPDPVPCVPFPTASAEVELVPAFPLLAPLEAPVALTRAGDAWLLIQRTGEVFRFDVSSAQPEPILDLSDRVDALGDAGLSAIALDPAFESNQTFYLFYATSEPAVLEPPGTGVWRSRLSRFQVGSPDEHVLLEVEQTEESHIHANGDLQFGPDGRLYASLGDGGPQSDPNGRGQDLGVLQGKLLRIGVDPVRDTVEIPPDNPFVNTPGARPEIWAFGLRNPWRFSLDAAGTAWVGDVGYTDWEEINAVHAGDNLGWSILEGPDCFDAETCDRTGLVDAAVVHDHFSARSVIGGRFYQGDQLDALAGHYVYADYQYGQLWAFADDRVPRLLNSDGHPIVSFAEDDDGELLVVDIADGHIYRIVDGRGVPGEDDLPPLLSETNCVDPADPHQKVDGLVPYDVAHPFWSDGATKTRWLALPPDGVLTPDDEGDLDVPIGTVLVKEFEIDGFLLETRFMGYRGDGLWTAVSYQWNAEQTDATLLPDADDVVTVTWPTTTWTHPTRGMCRECHYKTAGGSLGLELRQLPAESFDRLQLRGWLNEADRATPFPALDDETASTDARARAYLHVNCAPCHQPGARGSRSPMDLRVDIPLAETMICDVAPKFGDLTGPDARLVAPGSPDNSVVLFRMAALGDDAMPPIGRYAVDEAGVALLREWITGLTAEDCIAADAP